MFCVFVAGRRIEEAGCSCLFGLLWMHIDSPFYTDYILCILCFVNFLLIDSDGKL